MSLFKKLSTLLRSSTRTGGGDFLHLAVRCRRCGEVVRAQVNLYNDLSVEYDTRGEIRGYSCRKVLMGTQHCFEHIEVSLTFDARRRLTDREIAGGTFADEAQRA